MGAIYSLLGYDLKTDDPDPITGLTSKQKHIVKSTWSVLKKDPKSHGVNLFLTFFKYHPGYQKYFPFRDVPTDELADSKIFQAHCLNVIYALSAIVDNVDNSEIMVSLLKKNGESHGRRNVPAQAYWDIKPAVMETLEKGLGSKMTKDVRDTWNKTLDVALKVIADEVAEYKTTKEND